MVNNKMYIKIGAVLFLGVLLASCSNSSRIKHSAVVGTSTISWNTFNLSSLSGQSLPAVGPNERIYIVSRASLSEAIVMSDGRTLLGGDCVDLVAGQRIDISLTGQILNECEARKRERNVQEPLGSFDDFIRDAFFAINANENCSWQGYDRQFDLRVRSYGALASSRDERLFFAKIRCVA